MAWSALWRGSRSSDIYNGDDPAVDYRSLYGYDPFQHGSGSDRLQAARRIGFGGISVWRDIRSNGGRGLRAVYFMVYGFLEAEEGRQLTVRSKSKRSNRK